HSQITGPFSLINDGVYVWQFVLPFRSVVRNITWELLTGVDGSLSSMGLYSANRNRLLHTGAVGTAIADQGIQQTSITAVTLEPGVYFFAHTSTSLNVDARAWNLAVGVWGPVMNSGSSRRIAIAANLSSGGVLPATLGNLTSQTNMNPPICLFEP
ncbi:hypothetical protein LCGC14_3061140, partial [marine sediment metagenome]